MEWGVLLLRDSELSVSRNWHAGLIKKTCVRKFEANWMQRSFNGSNNIILCLKRNFCGTVCTRGLAIFMSILYTYSKAIPLLNIFLFITASFFRVLMKVNEVNWRYRAHLCQVGPTFLNKNDWSSEKENLLLGSFLILKEAKVWIPTIAPFSLIFRKKYFLYFCG